jgi:hypothetical protein
MLWRFLGRLESGGAVTKLSLGSQGKSECYCELGDFFDQASEGLR